MKFDKQFIYSLEQAITATAFSTNALRTASAYAGIGRPMRLGAVIDESFNNLTSLTIELQTDSVVGFGSAKTLWSKVVLLADLEAGDALYLPPWPADVLAFTRLNYTVTGTAPTTGKLTIGPVPEIQANPENASV